MHSHRPVLLIVEDDFLVRLTLVDALSELGFEILEAEDARNALSLLCDRPDIELMLSDINLPGEADGFALAKAARVIRPRLPVIYASGRYSRAEAHQQVEGARFLAKPFTPTLAAVVIHELLEKVERPVVPKQRSSHAANHA
ncbi:response regulator [Paeniroseomonas aquatica]|uniref:Response regulator n=1 Tax=Paeniroseomonas aquatica TaxID=373043 RepID=A0ABT8A941_9PROT|nr:response regulator [Paeniroseomonas aquatica]MDN3566327.1 response regulator [Paeniroseomonas aquatica]